MMIRTWPTWPDDRPYEFDWTHRMEHGFSIALVVDFDRPTWGWMGKWQRDFRIGFGWFTIICSWGTWQRAKKAASIATAKLSK